MRNFTQGNAVKKIVIERPGGYDRLQIKEFPTPTPQNHEVLIEVSAAGVNFADVFSPPGSLQISQRVRGLADYAGV